MNNNIMQVTNDTNVFDRFGTFVSKGMKRTFGNSGIKLSLLMVLVAGIFLYLLIEPAYRPAKYDMRLFVQSTGETHDFKLRATESMSSKGIVKKIYHLDDDVYDCVSVTNNLLELKGSKTKVYATDDCIITIE